MNVRRVAAYAATGAVVAWAAKALVIWRAGGLDLSPLEGPLFGAGMLLLLVAFAAAGVAAAGRRAAGWKVLGGGVALALGAGAFLLVESWSSVLVPGSAGWVQEEAGLWVAGTLAAGVLWWWASRPPARAVR